ncbi:MAG TPA: sulfatase [Phycisphaerae bacterium]|nr:sulfatase [Phycisphaerae bacterium]
MHPPNRFTRRTFLRGAGAAAVAVPTFGSLLAARQASAEAAAPPKRPNILFAIADDWSFPHAGIYGDKVVRTPTFDRIAREGVLFTNAYCAAPSCTPSRATVLTGQMFYRLGAGANLYGPLAPELAVYPDLLEAAGYHVGFTGKGWGPGDYKKAARTRNPAGPSAPNFQAFLASVPEGKPFCFWFGSHEPHRGYKKGSGVASGKRLEDVSVPPSLPDAPEVRGDILDYYVEVEQFDSQVAGLVSALESAGRLDDTLLVVTSDNGMPFPRAKTNLYDAGTRMPLAVRWPGRAKPGRTVTDFVGFHDFAPTFLEAAGVAIPPEMTGRSLLPALASGADGRTDAARDRVVTGRERHATFQLGGEEGKLGYPMRALRTDRHLYIRNFAPDRFPAGPPPTDPRWTGEKTAGGFVDIDGGPTKAWVWQHRAEEKVAPLWDLATAKRPPEELYDLAKDPHQLTNVADRPEYADALKTMADALTAYLTETCDPRVVGGAEVFET